MDKDAAGKCFPFLLIFPKVAKVGPEGGQGLQKDTKMEPRGTKMESQGLPKSGFGLKNVVKKGR